MKTEELAAELLSSMQQQKLMLATAESCTGGGIGHALTSVPGSSAAYLGGIISYQNRIKEQILHVPAATLEQHGAVSEQTASAMVVGCMTLFHSDLAISVTGLAGPTSDESGKPVGLVYIGVGTYNQVLVHEYHFSGSRDDIRQQSIDAALQAAIELLHS